MIRLVFLILLAIIGEPAYAARMPDTVQKEFIIEGDNAVSIAEFLGFPSKADGKYYLPWAPNTSECYKGANENGPIYEICDPTRHENIVQFYSGQNPKLIISGYWLDGETGSMEDVPKYSFMSPRIAEEENILGWQFIANKFDSSLSVKNRGSEVLSDSRPLVTISIYTIEGVVKYKFGIDDRSPEEREQSMKKYMNCIEWHKKNPVLDGGC